MFEDSNKSGKYPPVSRESLAKAMSLIAIGLVFVAVAAFVAASAIWKFNGFFGSTAGGIALVGGACAFAAVLHLWRK